MPRAHIDIESFSEVDLTDVGVYRYAEHPSTRINCIAVAVDNHPVKIVVKADEFWPLGDKLNDYTWAAHNAEFERVMLSGAPGRRIGFPQIPIDQWVCTAAKCAVHALPRKLEDAAKALRLDFQIDPGKRANMLKTAKLQRGVRYTPDSHPDIFAKLYADCCADVEAERAVDKLLPDLRDDEQILWVLDQQINQRGFLVDLETATWITKLRDEYLEELVAECIRICGYAPTQVEAVRGWLQSKGVELPDLTKKTVENHLKGDDERVLRIRQEASKTSVSKFDAMRRIACADGRVRGAFMFHGASPGRWTGKLVQPHNLAKPSRSMEGWEVGLAENIKGMSLGAVKALNPEVMDALSSCGRPMIVAPKGRELIVSDFSSIESRIVAWMADETWKLDVFNTHGKIYEAVAAKMFRLPEETILNYKKKHGHHHPGRDLGKRTELSCGYAGGVAAVRRSPGFDNIKPVPTDEEVQDWVTAWRIACPRTVAMWKGLERLMVTAIESGQVTQGYKCRFGVIDYSVEKKLGLDRNPVEFLKIQLPSGRGIYFAEPRVEIEKVMWNEEKKRYVPHDGSEAKIKLRKTITFMQVIKGLMWIRDSAHGGIFLQNIVEGIGRDLLKNGMFNLVKNGYPDVILHVHDEIGAEVDAGTGDVEEFSRLMCRLPKWAQGLPVTTAGYRAKRYHKD